MDRNRTVVCKVPVDKRGKVLRLLHGRRPAIGHWQAFEGETGGLLNRCVGGNVQQRHDSPDLGRI